MTAMRQWILHLAQRGALAPGDSPLDALTGSMLAAQRRERDRLRAEVRQIRALMPLLMKQRNGGRWTREERLALRDQLLAAAHLSPYLLILLLPGSVILLPLLAWWLDRRRMRRVARRGEVAGVEARG